MDSYRASGGFRSELEGLGIRYRPFPGDQKKRDSGDIGHDSRDGEMTTIKMLIASGLLALAANAVVPEFTANKADCKPTIECGPKEAIR